MPNPICEVIVIRRITSIFLLLVLLLGAVPFAVEAQAADLSSKAGLVATSGGALTVRSTASTSGAKLTSLKKGSYVTLISKSGSWWRVEYEKGKYGYCHADYITTVSGTPTTVQTSAGSLNVRSGPGTSYGKTGMLAKGETVIVLSTSGGWSRVLFHGTKTGYVSAQYLSSRYAEISLWLRNFKQNDDRWKNTVIGTSGKTFAQIGCATTAIAILEGHRTGKLIYPNEMAKQLTYTASGSVYWPSWYTAVTDGSDLLSGLYARLKQGKPIIFGATNSYGGQHWVVITGHTGGSTLTASGFTIHDPGTYSRTNLQQFLDVYPNFYKYFFY